MANEIWPDEGLDLVLGVFPKGGTNVATTYIALWGTSYTANTVGGNADTRASYTEPSTGAYARLSIASNTWGVAAAGTGGRKTVGAQQTFATATAVWGTINGFMLCDSSVTAQGKAYMACNFDDTTAVTINTNDVIKVTPTIQYNN